jgi:Pre-mRNA splicing Prp18-interacting factor
MLVSFTITSLCVVNTFFSIVIGSHCISFLCVHSTLLLITTTINKLQDLHPLADPSQAELLHKQFETRKEDLKNEQRTRILDKYGGQEHMSKQDGRLALGQVTTHNIA